MPDVATTKNCPAVVAFGDVVRQVKDKVDPEASGLERYIAGQHMDTDDLCIRRWGGIGQDYLGPAFHMRFKPGHVLYGSRRTYLRKIAVAHFAGITANTTYVLESRDPDVLLPGLLPFIMQTEPFHEHSKRESKGSVNPYVNFSDLAWYEFALPPLEEQIRIAGVLQAAEANCAALVSARTACREAYQAICKRLFVEERERRATATVADVADVQNGMTPRRNRIDYWGGDVPWLPTAKVNERRIKSADEFITQKALDECSVSVIPAGSILIAMIGQGATRGRAAILEMDATINQNFAAVTPRERMLPSFLYYQLDALYEALRNWSHGSNQKALNCQLVRDFRIWVPTEMWQREISERLDQISAAQESLANRGLLAKELKKGLLGMCLEKQDHDF